MVEIRYYKGKRLAIKIIDGKSPMGTSLYMFLDKFEYIICPVRLMWRNGIS